MHTIIFKYSDYQFNVSTIELENLIKKSYFDSYKTHSNGSQRQINVSGIDSFTIVTPHCTDTALELVRKFKGE